HEHLAIAGRGRSRDAIAAVADDATGARQIDDDLSIAGGAHRNRLNAVSGCTNDRNIRALYRYDVAINNNPLHADGARGATGANVDRHVAANRLDTCRGALHQLAAGGHGDRAATRAGRRDAKAGGAYDLLITSGDRNAAATDIDSGDARPT